MDGATTDVPTQHIRAAIRLRPLLPSEEARGEAPCLSLIPLSEMNTAVPSSSVSTTDGERAGIGGPEFGIRASVPVATTAERDVLRGPRPRPAAAQKGVGSARARAALSSQLRVQDFCFDLCLGPGASQSAAFEILRITDYCDDAVDGRAATILCFGQTGSGKTFTLSGGTLSTSAADSADTTNSKANTDSDAPLVTEDGLQYRAVHYLVQCLAARRAEANVKSVVVKCAYIELYNELLYDLLQGTSNLRCRWSAASQAFFVEDCLLVECVDVGDFLLVLREGQASRHRAGHLLNTDSSRSHVFFTVYIETHYRDSTPSTYGKLTFVDLAGSERLSETGSDGEDTKSINKSLFALGHVIETLSRQEKSRLSSEAQRSESDGGKAKPMKKTSAQSGASEATAKTTNKKKTGFVPYRSSVLTQLLMDSLGGQCRTLMVACVTPSSRFYEESLKTLHYAQRTRCIAATPVRRVDVQEAERLQLLKTLRALQRENAIFRRCLGLPAAPTTTRSSTHHPHDSDAAADREDEDGALTEASVNAHIKQLLEAYAQSRVAATTPTRECVSANDKVRKPTSAPAGACTRVRELTGRLTPLTGTAPPAEASAASTPHVPLMAVSKGRHALPPLSTADRRTRVPRGENGSAWQDEGRRAEEQEEQEELTVQARASPSGLTFEVDMGTVEEEQPLHEEGRTPHAAPPATSAQHVLTTSTSPSPLAAAPLAGATPEARRGFSVLDMLNALPDTTQQLTSSAPPPVHGRFQSTGT